MGKVDDVAAAIIARTGPLDTWRLQKLVYYCQAWHLVWDGVPLFADRVEAWANGPVIPALYRRHRGQFTINSWASGDRTSLTKSERETVDAVLKFYGDKPGYWLSELTHRERPWKHARKGLSDGERGNKEITKESMAEYYGGLL
jgi:uncharacterized phage-associated protein